MSLDKNSAEFQQYAAVGRFLYEQVEPLTQQDDQRLRALGRIVRALAPIYYDKHPGEYREGDLLADFMLEMSNWVGLKMDTPEMADEQGESIKVSFPEFFISDTL